MSSSNTVLRRYTPPTCTLEITASGSPLERWLGRPALKQLQFQLGLDDPRLPEEKRLTLKGDKTQLEALHQAVETYVQDLLLPDYSSGLLSTASTDTVDPLLPSSEADLTSDDRDAMQSGDRSEVESGEAPPAVGQIYLHSSGALTHNLYLGSLATEESGEVVSLSTLQLFDLATALQQYSEELVVLPNLKRANTKGFATRLQTTPIWAKTAAVLLLTAGATAAGVKLLNRNTPVTADAPPVNPQPTPTEQPPIAAVPSPSPTLVVPTPPLSSSSILPSPMGATTTPSPNASPSLGTGFPTTAASPSLGTGVTPSPNASPTPGTGVTPSPNASPTPSTGATPSPGNLPTFRTRVSPSPNTSPSGSYNIPGLQSGTRRQTPAANPRPTQSPQVGNTPRAQRRVSTESRPTQQQAAPSSPASSPVRTQRATRSTPTQADISPTTETPKVTPAPTRVRAPIPAPTITPPPLIPTPPPPSAAPNAIATPPMATPTAIPTPMAAAPAVIPTPTRTATNPDSSVAALRSAPTANPEANRTPTVDAPIPQVAEVQSYFQQRWQPPSSLTQDIEYSLSLNPDGSIKNVLPRGQTAEIYLDRTEMPLVGEPFVSPIDGGRNTTIILVLSKDGKVQAFLGPSN